MSSNSNSQRAIILDDSDPSLRYSGPWNPFESPSGLLGTVHRLIAPTGTAGLSVNFTGTSVIGFANSRFVNGSANSPTPAIPYTINCVIDGVSVWNTTAIEMPLAMAICDVTQFLPAGTHTLDVSWAFPTPNPNFEFDFDYFLVTPGQNQTITAQEDAFFFATDPSIQTSIQQSNDGWVGESNFFQTSVHGSQFTFQFTGISIMWFGKRPSGPPLSNTTATYTIDDGIPLSFDIFNSTDLPSQPELFQTQQYPYGDHTLHVVYQGNNDSIPLSLFALAVLRIPPSNPDGPGLTSTGMSSFSTLPVQSPSSQASSTNPPSMTTASSHHGTDAARVGGIVGGVVGFAALVGLVVCFLLFHRKRSWRNRPVSVSLAPSEYLDDDNIVPDPFPVSRAPSGRWSDRMTAVPNAAEELHWTAAIGTGAAQCSPTTPVVRPQPNVRPVYHDRKGINNDAQREEDSGMRVVQPTTRLPPLYTVN